MPTLDKAHHDGAAAPNTQADLASRPGRNPLKHLPLRLHHYASVVKDQEVNRQFFEDILGIPLVATWCERAISGELGIEMEYSHTLYALADGSALAFFQFADQGLYERCKAVPEFGRFHHCAFKVDRSTYDEIDRRLEEAGIQRRHTDHGYTQSLYVHSPDDLKVEFAVDREDAEKINAQRRSDAHSELARWLKGDRTPNNIERS